jgi:cell wall-associated NlpC family hydrolase
MQVAVCVSSHNQQRFLKDAPMSIPTAIITEARGWLGTRFAHQGRLKKTPQHRGGVDCLGLLVGVADALDIYGHDRDTGAPVRLASLDSLAYGHQPDGAVLQARLEQWLTNVRLEDMQPADVLLCRFDRTPQHVALVTDYAHGGLGIIHAHAQARGVVEHALDAMWRGRVVAAYSLIRTL